MSPNMPKPFIGNICNADIDPMAISCPCQVTTGDYFLDFINKNEVKNPAAFPDEPRRGGLRRDDLDEKSPASMEADGEVQKVDRGHGDGRVRGQGALHC